MSIKTLFKPKEYIHALSNEKINWKSVFFIFLIIFLTFFVSLFGFDGDGLKILKLTLSPLNKINGLEKLSIIFSLIARMIYFILLYLIIYGLALLIGNFIVKKALQLFKINLTMHKLLNISVYSILFRQFIYLILTSTFAIIIAIPGHILNNIPTQTNYEAIIYTIILVIQLFTLMFYFYGVAIATKK